MSKKTPSKSNSDALSKLLKDSKPLGATNPEHSHVVLQMLIEAAQAYSENDIGNGYLALCRAMAAASVVNEKALAQCYADSPKHQEYAKQADALFVEVVEQPMAVMQAHAYYINNSPFRVAPAKQY